MASEFSAIANLEVTPTDASLRATRRQIESELGDIEVGVTANRPTGGGGGAIGHRGPEPAGIDLARRQLGSLEQLISLADRRNELLGGAEGGGGPSTPSTAAMIEIQRRTLRAQRASADADVVTNEILEDILDTLQDGGPDGGGGGGALRTAGTLGLAASATGVLGGLVANPFTALAAATLAGGAAAAGAGGTEVGRRGPGPTTRPPDRPSTRLPGPFDAKGNPFVGFGEPPTDAPRADPGPDRTGGDTNVDVRPNFNIDIPSIGVDNEIRQFIEGRLDDFKRNLEQDFENLFGGGTGPRTGGGAFAAKGNPFNRRF